MKIIRGFVQARWYRPPKFTVLAHGPTRENAILDPIIIHEDMPFSDCGVIETPANISDHKATFLIIPFEYEIHNTYTRLVWLYKGYTKGQTLMSYDMKLQALIGTFYTMALSMKHVTNLQKYFLK